MKTAIYIEGDMMQVVLTPENKAEENIVALLEGSLAEAQVYRGSFYECQGGWVRHGGFSNSQDRSLIIRVTGKAEPMDTADPLDEPAAPYS